MTITTTGIAFLVSSIGLAFCGIRFFEAFNRVGSIKKRSRVGFLLSTYFLISSLQHLLLSFSIFFYLDNLHIFNILISVDHFLLSLAAIISVYTLFYVFYPKISYWIGVFPVFILCVILVFLTIQNQLSPVVNEGSLDWKISEITAIPLLYVSLIAIGAPFMIFVKNILVFGFNKIFLSLSIVHFLGLLNVTFLFIKYSYLNFGISNYFFDRLLVLIGLIFLYVFMITPLIAERHR